MAVGQDDDRRISQADAKVGVSLHDSLRMADILRGKRFELIGAPQDLVNERRPPLVTDSAGNQLVHFCQHKG